MSKKILAIIVIWIAANLSFAAYPSRIDFWVKNPTNATYSGIVFTKNITVIAPTFTIQPNENFTLAFDYDYIPHNPPIYKFAVILKNVATGRESLVFYDTEQGMTAFGCAQAYQFDHYATMMKDCS